MADRKYGLQGEESTPRRKVPSWALLLALPLLALLGMSMSTLKVASDYGFQSSLGQPWFFIGSIPFYAPWSVFTWKGIDPRVMDSAETVGLTFFILPVLFVMLYVKSRDKQKGNVNLHGSAHWAEKGEIERMGYFGGKGVYVGGYWDEKAKQQLYLRHNGPEHILCFAPTRSGKGVGLILPTLLSWPASSLTLDIKGENWALTSGYRKSCGHTVLRFDPTDASGSGCAFNPLEEIRLMTLEAVQDVQNMALMLIDPDGKGLADHWTKAAFGFFSGVILHVCLKIPHEHNRIATLHDLVLFMSSHERTTEELLDEMAEGDHAAWLEEYAKVRGLAADPRAGSACHEFIASSAGEMQKKEDKEASGVLSSAAVNMALYRDPIVDINTSRSDFRIHDLMNRDAPVDLYLVVPPSGIDRVRPLMRLMVDLIIRRVCATMEFKDGASVAGYKHRLLLMLDEFTSLGKLPIIEKAIAYIAGYGGKMYIIVQDTKQLNGVYGKENAIMANCHVRIAYAPNDPDTAELLSKMTGKTTVVEKKTSVSTGKGGTSRSTNISEVARPLLTPDECSRLPGPVKDAAGKILKPGHMLIFTAGQSPIYGRQILYFLDPVFSSRARIPAPGITSRFPAGITDSVHFPRPEDWYTESENSLQEEQEMPEPLRNFIDYLENVKK